MRLQIGAGYPEVPAMVLGVPVRLVVCSSNVHRPPVPAMVLGTFGAPWLDVDPAPAAYCHACAVALEALGVFTPEEDP
jgi:hypothetical protein